MIFDDLWRAERRQSKEAKRLAKRYKPLIDIALKNKDYAAVEQLRFEWDTDGRQNDEADELRSRVLVTQARKLGIELPKQPNFGPDDYDHETWYMNTLTGNIYLTRKAYFDTRKRVLKEKSEVLDYRTRWVTRVVVPVAGLLSALAGVISLLYACNRSK